jgi:hypothetical protein
MGKRGKIMGGTFGAFSTGQRLGRKYGAESRDRGFGGGRRCEGNRSLGVDL